MYLEEGDVVLLAEGLDELDVERLLAVGGEYAQVSVTLVERLGRLAQTAHEAVGHDGRLQYSPQCFINVHLANNFGRCWGWFISAIRVSK